MRWWKMKRRAEAGGRENDAQGWRWMEIEGEERKKPTQEKGKDRIVERVEGEGRREG